MTSTDILENYKDIAQDVIRVEISDSEVICLHWIHLEIFENVKEISCNESQLTERDSLIVPSGQVLTNFFC